MNITIIDNIIENIILVVFPLLVYLVLKVYNDNISKKNNDVLITISLITSLYLCLKLGTISTNPKVLLFCNIPIIISYLHKKPFLGIFLSLTNVIYYIHIYPCDTIIIIILIKYISYLILYICANK